MFTVRMEFLSGLHMDYVEGYILKSNFHYISTVRQQYSAGFSSSIYLIWVSLTQYSTDGKKNYVEKFNQSNKNVLIVL